MKNSIIKAGLAVAMTLGLAAPVFAAPTDVVAPGADGAYGAGTTITGTVEVPTIKITVPDTGTVIVNPFKMAADMDGLGSGTATSKESIVSVTQYLASESNVPISVSMSATGTAAGEAVLGTALPTATTTTKTVYMFAQVAPAAGTSGTPTIPEFTGTWTNKYDAKTCALVSAKPVLVKDVATIAPGTSTAPAFLAYRLNGEAATKPAKAWVAADTVGVALAFTFVPQVTPATP